MKFHYQMHYDLLLARSYCQSLFDYTSMVSNQPPSVRCRPSYQAELRLCAAPPSPLNPILLFAVN